ncbi:PREDICTED: NADP-dependent malic enzyme isoform X2 [Bactrocera latifrons]|uniref:Malic enzyme n=1 Tax=Bactrocera latifrons TaxID=174628 RepID=A0A0K8WI45_BACLA|nr:PREDICTED: NADP-dependent malic enzyme isoform X2 [Bactrocera latifrons]XP_039967580.1 NADP-dependent malic enzyme isoform X2 [Bactrocera tryoni]
MLSRPILHGNLSKLCAASRPAAAAAAPVARQIATSDSRPFHDVVGDVVCPSGVRGIDHLRDPRLNKGLAFTLEERQTLGIHGLQPARFKTQEEQLELCKIAVSRYTEPLNKYLYLVDLQDRNERLFYRFLAENIEHLMPIVYTPTVGLACQRFGLIYRRPRGLFISYNDRGYVFDVIKNWPESDVRAICVTDGERILGLGDLGANGMGICVGKLALYTALAGIKPHRCLPILLDVGTNNIDLLEDPLYVGLRQKRVVGKEYDDFLDEFMEAIVKRYGQNTLIQFEDFGNHNAFRFLDRYRNSYCTFNDDIQGTAAVAMGGIYASTRVTGKSITDYTFLFAGAGEAAVGIADLVVKAMVAEGVPKDEARQKIWMIDIDGLLTTTRKEGSLSEHQKNYAKDVEPMKNLQEIVEKVKPNVLIGASAAAGIFTPEILRIMATNNERPVVFALSNPTHKAECTADQAYKNTDGRVVFSSGSPFPPVEMNGKTFYPGQGNNAYIFPGIALGVITTGTHHISDDMFLIAARELANFVDQSDLDRGSLYPPLNAVREVSMRIAEGVTKCAYDKGLASTYPEPSDKRKWLQDQLYNFNYESSMPVTWPWPRMPYVKTRPLEPTILFSDSK